MLEAAQRLATERQVTNVRFTQGEAHALPFASSSIDVVACRYSAHHFAQIAHAIQEWVRVLVPVRKLIVADTVRQTLLMARAAELATRIETQMKTREGIDEELCFVIMSFSGARGEDIS